MPFGRRENEKMGLPPGVVYLTRLYLHDAKKLIRAQFSPTISQRELTSPPFLEPFYFCFLKGFQM
jgi:hypothetical protein